MAVEKYGRNRMNVEVSKLRSQLREVEEKCVDVSFFNSHVSRCFGYANLPDFVFSGIRTTTVNTMDSSN